MSKASDLLARANSLIVEEIKSETRLNVLHLIVSEKEVLYDKYYKVITASRIAKPERNNNDFRISVKVPGTHGVYGIKYFIECLSSTDGAEDISSDKLLTLIEMMTAASNVNRRPFKIFILNGLPFKLMVHNRINCTVNDEVFKHATSFITDIILNMFNNGSVRDDLDGLANDLEIKAKERKEKVHAMLEEKKKNDPNRKSRVLTPEERKFFRNKKKELENITVNYDEIV